MQMQVKQVTKKVMVRTGREIRQFIHTSKTSRAKSKKHVKRRNRVGKQKDKRRAKGLVLNWCYTALELILHTE